MRRLLKKIHIALLVTVVIASSAPTLLAPQTARAVFGLGDIAFTFESNPLVVTNTVKTSAESSITAGATSGLLAKEIYKEAKAIVLSVLKRQILDVMVNQVVTWIQGGGEPRFITDWGSFMGNIAQGAAGEFVQMLGAGFLCEPFSLKLRIGLLPVQRFGGGGSFSCTLDEIVSNIENFYDDFRNGGWIAYDAAWQPQNNYYGSLLLAWDAQNNYVADKLAASANEALANNNFLSTKRCYNTVTGETVPEPAAGSFGAFTKCETVTPGKVAGDAIAKAVGVDFDFIVNAEELSDYAAAIVNALINRVIMEGVNGLRGVHSGSGSTYNPSRNAGATTGGFSAANQIPANIGAGATNFNATSAGTTGATVTRTALISNINTAITTRTTLNATLEATLALEEPIVTAGQNAIACQTDIIQRCPTCQPSISPPDWPGRRTLQQERLDIALLSTQPLRNQKDRNNEDIAALRTALTQLTALTDAQYTARQTEFITAIVISDPSQVNILLPSARLQLSQSQQTAPATLADVQRDVDYCRGHLNQLP